MYIVVLEDKDDPYKWHNYNFDLIYDAMEFAIKNHYKFVMLKMIDGCYSKTIYNCLFRKSEDNFIFCLDCRFHE